MCVSVCVSDKKLHHVVIVHLFCYCHQCVVFRLSHSLRCWDIQGSGFSRSHTKYTPAAWLDGLRVHVCVFTGVRNANSLNKV